MASKIGAQIAIEGEAKYRQQLSLINSETKKFASQVKAVSSSIDKEGGSIKQNNELKKKLQSTIDSLNQKLEQQKKHFDEANQAYSQSGVMTQKQVENLNKLATEIANTETQLNNYKQQLKEVPGFMETISRKAEQLSGNIKKFGDQLGSIGKDLTTKLTAPIVGLGTIGINYNAQMEQYKIMLTTLTGSAEEADRVITQLQQDAAKSPFDTSSLVKANQYLLSTGEDADKARNMISYLGDAIAATGGGSAELDRMAANLQQIKNLGKASAVDIKQFANAGIDIYGLLADYMGVTTAEAKEMEVTYESLYGAFEKAASEGGKYFGAMEGQSKTLNGQISNLKDNVTQLLGELTAELMPVIKDIVEQMKNWVQAIKNMSPEQKKMITNVAKVLALAGPLLTVIGKIVSAVGGVIGVVGKIAGLISKAGPVIAAIKAALAGIATFLGVSVGAAVAIIAGAIAAIIGIIAAIKNWDKVSAWLANTWETIKGVFANFGTALGEVATSIKEFVGNAFTQLGEKLKQDVDQIVNWFVTGWTFLKDTTANLWNALKESVSTIVTNLKNRVVELFTEIRNKIVDWMEKARTGVQSKVESVRTTIVNGIQKAVDFLKSLPSQALTWGKDLISNFVGGIKSMMGSVGSAVSGIASKVKGYLGFSEPDVGPLSDFHTYMPDMMKLMAKGINDNAYLVEDALSNVTGMMSGDIEGNGSPNYNYGGVVINMNVPEGANGRMLVEEIENELAQRTVRRKAVFG